MRHAVWLTALAIALPQRALASDLTQQLLRIGAPDLAVAELHRQNADGGGVWHLPENGVPVAEQLLAADRADLAVEVLDAAQLAADDTATQGVLALHLALAQAKAGQIAAAVHGLLRVEQFGPSPLLRARAAALRCAVHLLAVEVQPSLLCVQQHLGDAADRNAVADLSLDAETLAFRAGLASAVVPGLGQLWAGQPAQAASAFAVNGGLIGSTTALIAHAAYLDAGLLFVAMTLRYYVGNIEHAVAAARQSTLDRQRSAAGKLAGQFAVQ